MAKLLQFFPQVSSNGIPSHGFPTNGYPSDEIHSHRYPSHGFPSHRLPIRGFPCNIECELCYTLWNPHNQNPDISRTPYKCVFTHVFLHLRSVMKVKYVLQEAQILVFEKWNNTKYNIRFDWEAKNFFFSALNENSTIIMEITCTHQFLITWFWLMWCLKKLKKSLSLYVN